ncbi:MAG: hypothetical protein ABIW76_16075 [Fibrobacteria bacterium]
MFEKYDLRWPEEMNTKASVPAQAQGTYEVFATKETILSLGAESYVLQISRWVPSYPVSLTRLGFTSLKQPGRMPFNIKGQRLNSRGHQDLTLYAFPKRH